MKPIIILFLSCFLIILSACQNNTASSEKNTTEYTYRIPAGENSWLSNDQNSEEEYITESGIRNWNGDIPIKTYFRTTEKGSIQLGLNVKTSSENTSLQVTLNGDSREIILENQNSKDVYLGEFNIKEAGYQEFILETNVENENQTIEINEVLLGGKVANGNINYVEDNFHFGRRGPSVHLRYEVPEEGDILYFYNEIEVPQGEDVIGSYFMANGFSDGYFGIQVNSEKERRILFSVWSPYDTQDPDEIPDDYKIELLKKGENVYSGEFGNEGSGGQSYKVFNWKSDTTYKFLLKGEPAGDNKTDYTAWFYAPEKGDWELIASFRRPYTDTYLADLYSFLENFVPATGDTSRKALYKNQWVFNEKSGWIESVKARFTADATANQEHRLDYAGGVENGVYFMKNCGFFDETTPVDTIFEREATGNAPQINFKSLP